MDTVQGMRVFVKVAQRAGFAKAGRDLHMSPAAVTKHVAFVEERVGTRLLDRTTRKVSLTEAGRVYLERCLECLQAVEDADASVSELSTEPRGLLRVTAPFDFLPVVEVLSRLAKEHPKITVDLRLSNRTVDLVEEGFDVAIRVATALDGRYVARPLAQLRAACCAAPEYLRAHGRPRRPEDLAKHRSIVFVEPRVMDELVLQRGGRKVRAKLNAVMTSNSGDAIRAAVVDGLGIGLFPSMLLRKDDFTSGRLEPLLLDWRLSVEPRLFAVYPHRRFLPGKVRAFVEALRASFGDGTTDPFWPA